MCNTACKAKIILNGGNAAKLLDSACTTIEYLDDDSIANLDGDKIIKILNRMEDDAIEVQKLILEGVGYTGPVGKMLQ